MILLLLVFSSFLLIDNAFSDIISKNTTADVKISSPYLNLTVDFTPFHMVLKSALRRDAEYFTKNKLEYCWEEGSKYSLRDKTVMISYTNAELFPLVMLRHRVLRESKNGICAEGLLITICLDEQCMALCATHEVPNCVQLHMPKIPYVEFAGGFEYFYLTWLKYELAFSALDFANEVFYLDADVLLRRNPFDEVLSGRNPAGDKVAGEYDVMYQRERGMKELGCGGSVNGGLLYFRNSSQLRQSFIPKMLSHREEIMAGHGGRSDQEIMGDYVGLVRFCTLPVKLFTGHCMGSQFMGKGVFHPWDVITYHTNCVTGLKAKVSNMKKFLQQSGKVKD